MNALRDTLTHLLITLVFLLFIVILKSLGQSRRSRANSNIDPVLNLGIRVLATGDTPMVDIVAIHGLNGEREAAWTASGSGVLWLRDLLAPEIPTARILVYGYDANTSGTISTHQTIQRHAEDFLAKFAMFRGETNTKERPIVFVVHSLGGIIVKQALCHAFPAGPKHLPNYKAIQVSTSGIIFLGTPHQGANGVTLGRIVLQIQSFYSSTNDGILKHLARDSESLEAQQAHFIPISERVDMTFFYEAHATRLPGGRQIMLVPRSSAVVPGTRDAEAIAINKDHSGMSKFASPEDDDFRTVLESLRGMIRRAPEKIRREWVRYKRTETVRDEQSVINYVPSPSRHFTGRSGPLAELHKLFFGHRAGAVQERVLLHGMAGIGKTQIALRFAEQHADRFWRIFWIDANNTETIESSLRAIAVDDPEAKLSGVRESSQSVLRWISQADGEWLLIFDNADRDSSLVAKYLPPGNRGNVLITSLTHEMGHVVSHSLEIGEMEGEDADTLLLTAARLDVSPEELRYEARKIVAELSYLPLAVDQAGTAIARGLVDLHGYLTMYANHRQRLMAYPSFKGATNYGRAAYGTWDMLFQAINSLRESVPGSGAESAIIILETFAFLHPENLQEDIFRRAAENSEAAVPFPLALDNQRKWDPFSFNEGIEILLSYSLIRRGGSRKSYAVHRLVHNWSRDRIEPTDRMRKCASARDILVPAIPMGDTGTEYAFRRIVLPHIKANRQYAAEVNVPPSHDDEEFNKYWRCGIANDYVGLEDPKTLDSQDRLVVAYHLLEKWDEAERVGVVVVEGRTKILGRDDRSTLGTMSNLALTYKSQRKAREAEKLGLEVLERKRKTLGPEHPDLVPTMSNLASTYADLKQWEDGERLALKAIEMTRTQFGADHPRMIVRQLILVRIYIEQGRLDGAEELALKILAMSIELHGEENPTTLMCMSYMGMVHYHQGSTTKAVEILERALTIGQSVLGAGHPDLLRFQVNLDYLRKCARDETCPGGVEETESNMDRFMYRRWNT